ncbi:MAG: DUF4333 domain-containing protein [Solirubrobacteraceae bacterium]
MPKLAGLAAPLLGLLGLSACGSSTQSLNSAKIERSIAQSILKQHGLHAAVACPSENGLQKGRSFTCTARLDVGVYPVTVTETDGSGHVRYSDRRPLAALDIAKVQRAIEVSIFRQRHVSAKASCPAEVLQQAGVSFRCSAVIAGASRRYPFAVREIDNAGHVRYVST